MRSKQPKAKSPARLALSTRHAFGQPMADGRSMADRQKLKANRGATTILVAVFVLSILLMISLTAASVMIYEIRMAKEISDSIPAFMAADAAAEQCLYQARKAAGVCQNAGGTISVSLDNGATAVAQRTSGTIIESLGVYNQTNRKIQIEGTFGLTVTVINPDSGVKNTTVSNITVSGTGFLDGATVKLVKNSQIDILPLIAFSYVSETTLSGGAFDLTGANGGPWDVVVTNLNGQVGTLSNGFNVISN